MAAISTTVTELPESRVRVEAEVPAEEVARRIERKAREIGHSLKIPGFRKGKVPAPIVIRRLGREAVLDEAVRDAIGDWYSDAVDEAGIVTVGDPSLDLGDLPPEGEPMRFSVEIGVRPVAKLGAYKNLKVARPQASVDEQAVAAELEQLRARLARLETSEEPAGEGDFVVVDYLGRIGGEPFDGGEARDQLIELGGGRLIPGFEEGLLGASAEETRDVEVTFPADYGNERLAGKTATFEITVKEVKSKLLPELDDDFASDAAGMDSLEELRDDIEARLLEAEEARVRGEYREAVLDAAVAAATIEVPHALARSRAEETLERMLHSLAHQGISKEAYLQISGREEEDVLTEATPEAEQALKREALLAAVVAAESIEPSEEELLEALAPDAERAGTNAQALLEQLRKSKRLAAVRDDLAARSALDLMTESAVADS